MRKHLKTTGAQKQLRSSWKTRFIVAIGRMLSTEEEEDDRVLQVNLGERIGMEQTKYVFNQLYVINI